MWNLMGDFLFLIVMFALMAYAVYVSNYRQGK